jgi:hypothetical protein
MQQQIPAAVAELGTDLLLATAELELSSYVIDTIKYPK